MGFPSVFSIQIDDDYSFQNNPIMIKSFLSFILLFSYLPFLVGQSLNDSVSRNPWKLSGYAEAYLTYKSKQPSGQKLSDFQYNHNRFNKFSFNQACLEASYSKSNFRMNLGLQAGTYVSDNYAAEPAPIRVFSRASAAFRLSKKKEAWLEIGVLPSYVGFESVNAFENATLTRSLFAENSPYFLTGIQANYPIDEKNDLSFHIHTGWQRIVPQKANSLPSFGWQWVHSFNDDNKFNWSVWIGSDYPDSTRRMRYFNNLYYRGKNKKWAYTFGFDLGLEQKNSHLGGVSFWYSPVGIVQYSFTPKWRAAFRAERYADRHRVIVKPSSGEMAILNSQSLTIDFIPHPNLLCRVEARAFQAQRPIFLIADKYSTSTNYLTLSFAYQLSNLNR